MISFLIKKIEFLFKLDLLLKLIFSSKKIVEFYYKIINMFFRY